MWILLFDFLQYFGYLKQQYTAQKRYPVFIQIVEFFGTIIAFFFLFWIQWHLQAISTFKWGSKEAIKVRYLMLEKLMVANISYMDSIF